MIKGADMIVKCAACTMPTSYVAKIIYGKPFCLDCTIKLESHKLEWEDSRRKDKNVKSRTKK